MQTQSSTVPDVIPEADIRVALERIGRSELFAQSERLRGFLTYVVEETLAGRGDAIRGKTIAQDVYHREPTESGDPENIVRVHARQLRQNLSLYYETEGGQDPVRIHLDSGGYCPRFEHVPVQNAQNRTLGKRTVLFPLLAFLAGGLGGGILAVSFLGLPPVAPSEEVVDGDLARQDQLARQAVMEKSAASLQAVNLAAQARDMVFPIFDRGRQELVLTVFQHVIRTDPGFFGGYAGAGQSLATLAIISPPGEARNRALIDAREMVQKAVDLEPSEAWVQSALAWVTLAEGDYEKAFSLSSRAKEMDGTDGHILDFHGAVSLFSGRFEEALTAADRTQLKGGSNQRFAHRNIAGGAHFHLGNMEQTLANFDAAAAFGDPLSAPSLAYQAAALQNLGRTSAAKRKLAELKRAWPKASLDVMFGGIYQDPKHVAEILNPLSEVGWEREN